MPRLQINTKTSLSLYDPLEVEINGKVFKVKPVGRNMIKRIGELDAEVRKGNLDAAYERLELLIGKHKVIDELILEDLIEITDYITHNLIRPKRKEKNLQGPGAEVSQK